MSAIFVAGAHTDIGKTYVACALIAAARARGLTVDALKPAISGFDAADWAASDPGRLLAALGRAPDAAALEAISPWRFAAPLAPPIAAKLESRALPLTPIADFCRARISASPADLMLVEGVGGLMSPIADHATNLDLIEALDAPVLLVGGAYLGAISHLLTAIEVLRSHGRTPVAVVVSQGGEPDAPDFGETLASVREFAGLAITAALWEATDWAGPLAARLAAAEV